MRAFLRAARRLLSALGFIVLFVAAVVTGLLWLTLPPRSQQARIPGLSGPVDIGFDADGIPRIRAASELDAAAALGFVHARDRMFQMEMTRRAASGRLSEIAGPATLGYDRTMRTLGLRQAAEQSLANLPAETRAMLEAYAHGVNAWIGARGRFSAPEFLFFGAPEQWQPVDSLLWGEVMELAHRTVAPVAGWACSAAGDRRSMAAGSRRRAARRRTHATRRGAGRSRACADPAALS
jgi:penicillin amidase